MHHLQIITNTSVSIDLKQAQNEIPMAYTLYILWTKRSEEEIVQTEDTHTPNNHR